MTIPQNCVLVVDDSSASLSLLFQTLRQAYYRVFVAQSGADALRQIDDVQPDIILLDIDMPGMDGFETCRRLKSRPHTVNIPVIFMTVSDQVEDKVRGFDVGGVDYITKPAEPAELLARLNTHLTIRNLQQELTLRQTQLEADVEAKVAHIQAEIGKHKLQLSENETLLDLTTAQSDLLQHLLYALINGQEKELSSPADLLQAQVLPGLEQLKTGLTSLRQAIKESESPDDIVQQINTALQSLIQIQQQAQEVTARLAIPTMSPSQAETQTLLDQLSDRELQVLRMTAEGQETSQIAESLFLSENTVRVYRSRLMNKLKLDNLPALVKFALKHHLISLE